MFKLSKKVNPKQMGEGLWLLCKKFSKFFYEEFIPFAKELNIEPTQVRQKNLAKEIVIMNLWIISKTLSTDKKILGELHKIYIFGHQNLGTTEDEKTKFMKQAEKELHERYKKYYSTLEEKSQSDITAITILEHLLNDGKPNKKFINSKIIFFINHHLLGMSKAVLAFRKEFKHTEKTKKE